MSDSVIDYSILYYSSHEDNRKLALAYYLKGRIKAEKNNNKDAIKYLKKAESFAEKTDNDFLKMRICNNIAIINSKNEDYAAALDYELRAIEYGKNVDDKETLVACLLNVGGYYGNLNKPDSCFYYANKCLDYINDVPQATKASIYLNVAASIEDTDTSKAKEYALKSIELKPSNNAYQILAKVAREGKDYYLSEKYLNEALKFNISVDWEAFILYELAQTKELMGRHEEANSLSKQVIKLRDSVEAIKARDSIREIQIAYEKEETHQAKIEDKEDETMAVGIGLVLVIIAVVAFFVEKRRRLHKAMAQQQEEHRREIKEKEQEAKEKSREIEVANKRIERQKMRLKSKEERQLMQENESYRNGFAIYNKVKSGTEAVSWDKAAMRDFVMFYRSISVDFKNATDGKQSKISFYQQSLLAMKEMGMSTREIATTFRVSENAVRTQTSRIKKIMEGEGY